MTDRICITEGIAVTSCETCGYRYIIVLNPASQAALELTLSYGYEYEIVCDKCYQANKQTHEVKE